MRIDSTGIRWHTRYELCIEPYKGKLQATVYDEHWDSHELLWYSKGHPEKATGIGGQTPVFSKFWRGKTHEISRLEPGWYAVEMPATQYPFGDIFKIIRIPGRHLRYRSYSDERR